jgi:hypothetical protein
MPARIAEERVSPFEQEVFLGAKEALGMGREGFRGGRMGRYMEPGRTGEGREVYFPSMAFPGCNLCVT